MSSKSSVQSVRPPSIPSEQEGGPDAAVAERRGRGGECHQMVNQRSEPVFPVGKRDDVEEVAKGDELTCTPFGRKNKRTSRLVCPQSTSQRGLSIWTIALVIFRFVLGASTASKVADASSGTAA